MNKRISILLILFSVFSFSIEVLSENDTKLVINEICTNNKKVLKDKYGNYSSWIEIYNRGEQKLDISGYGLSNEFYIPLKWTFPKNTTLDSHDCLIVFISDKKSIENEFHTNFVLNEDGDQLFFSNPNAELIEKIDIPKLNENMAYVRGSDDTFSEKEPTPGSKNEMEEIEGPIFSETSGFFEDEFLLKLSSENEIYYTTDSSDPLNSETVQKYKEPIKIYDKSGEPNLYAEIGDDENSATFVGSMGFQGPGGMGSYKRPKYLLDKAMVVRAYTKNKEGISKVITHIYFVTTGNLANYKDFTIVSLVSNPENLFDPDKGIYVVGNEYVEAKKNMDPNDFMGMWGLMQKANFYKEGEEWEKETNLAIFEKGELTVQQNVGIKIRGFSTRMQAGKSFNVYAKKRFGEKQIRSVLFPENYDVNHNLIEKYKSIALRNVFSEERIKDEVGNKLLYGREFQAISDTKKCILFLNGEYWGFYILIEKFSESFIASHFDVPKDGVTLIKEGELSNGEPSEITLYNGFFNEYSKKDVTDEKVYKEIQDFVDIESLIEHFVIGVYIGTWDWPGHNDGVWRYNGEKIEDHPYTDGRWRYISFDFDYSMGAQFSMWGGGEQVEPYEQDNLKGLEQRNNVPTILFLPLLKNKEFRNKYILRFCDYVNEIFKIDRLDALIKDYVDNYLDKLAYGEVRWKGYQFEDENEAFATFKTNFMKTFEEIRKFFEKRPENALQHMINYLSLEEELKNVTLSIKGKGKIKINSITPEFKEGKWVGKYFTNIPITITAIPSEKAKFKGWTEDVESEEKTITVELAKDTKISAEFE